MSPPPSDLPQNTDYSELLSLTEKMLAGENREKLTNVKLDLQKDTSSDSFNAIQVLEQLQKALQATSTTIKPTWLKWNWSKIV